MDSRRPIDLSAILVMVMLCMIWSMQQIGFKASEEDAAPVFQLALRSGGAALLVWALVALRGGRIAFGGRVAALGALAGLFFALEYVALGEAVKRTTASHAVVFLYTAPIFAAVGLHLRLPSERLAPLQWLGILIAAAGIAYAFLAHGSDSHPQADGVTLVGDLLALLGGALWGATTLIIRASGLSRVPPSHTLFYQLAVGFLVLGLVSMLTGQASLHLTPLLGANLLFQTVVICFFSYLIWFTMLSRYVASQLGVFTFMTPLFGVMLGAVLLDEPLTFAFLAGTVAVCLGILLVSLQPWLAQRRRRRAGPVVAATDV